NVTLHLDGVLYLRVVDPYKASYGVEDPEFAVMQLAQTTMRSELGNILVFNISKISLDHMFQEREILNHNIVEAINSAAEVWGIKCLRYEIRDIQLPKTVVEAMQMQVEAERKKRANILQSEGEAEAIIAKAQARATGITKVAGALEVKLGDKAASLNVAELYVSAFANLAKTTNTVVLPASVGDASSMVAQALAVYGQITRTGTPPRDDPPVEPGPTTTPSPSDQSHLPQRNSSTFNSKDTQLKAQIDLNEIAKQNNLVGLPHYTAATSPTRAREY
ncbi:hypothetical protein QZH41_013646, partial [Actinostola sp. cb2023]